MANMQLQKTKAITTTAIKQKQSLEVVQTIVHGGLSSLSFLRDLFPEKSYVRCVYGEDDEIPSYGDYAAARLPRSRSLESGRSTIMQLLQRGKSRRVDTFLDWLERGAFPSMASGALRALQVLVHTEPDDRSRVLETYTFTIKYVRDTEDMQVPTGIEVNGPDDEKFTVGATGRALQDLILQIMTLCERLPQLPPKRYVSMTLFYNQDLDVPDGWTAGTSDKLFLGEAEGFKRYDETLDEVHSKFHETTFEMSTLQSTQKDTKVDRLATVPDDLTYKQERPLLEGNTDGTPGAANLQTAANPIEEISDIFAAPKLAERPSYTECGASTESVPIQGVTSVQSQPKMPREASIPLRTTTTLCSQGNLSNTQSSNVAEMKDAFRAMMQPEQITQGDTQTQGPISASDARSGTTASVSPNHSTSSPIAHEQSVSGPVSKSDPKLALSQTVAAKLEKDKSKLRKLARANKTSKESRSKDPEITACQCGCSREEGEMVNCNYCDTWQHLHCYGFISAEDPRLSNKHVCYQCLLGNTDLQTLAKLREVVPRRRIMHHALQGGVLKKPSDVAVSLQMSVTDTGAIIDYLQRKGYIVPVSTTRRVSYTRTTWTVVTSGVKHQEMLQDLFDPLQYISHHYELPEPVGDQTVANSLADAPFIQMPPPMTPASQLLKLVRTTGPAFNTRRSVTPIDTPSRCRSRPSLGMKRARDDQESDTTDQTRAKRVQTEYSLNADGLSSSPGGSAHG